MVKLLIELLEFLRSCAPLLTSLAVFTLLCILLSKSIRKHAKIYYFVLSIPFILIVLPYLAKPFGFEISGFARVPFLGEIIRDYIHMAAFGHPLLIIIMYMGALDMKTPGVKRLMSIRKELSIISGFPVLSHALIRVFHNLPASLKYFGDHAAYLAETKVTNELGAGITNFSFVWGILLIILFIPLWVTSFDSIRNRMGYPKWKKFQRWAYVMYAALFIHAVGIQVGFILNPRGGHAPQKPAVEQVVSQSPQRGNQVGNGEQLQARERKGNDSVKPSENKKSEQVSQKSNGKRAQSKGFADIKVSSQTKQYIHLFSIFLVYGSYLYLRVRKARRSGSKRKLATVK
ncbi:ferric reductase-like transmembrane domain-containing protein [Massilibacteroides sp.]|uniref:ferric reductase-like transmembrane domain-containing protein n=1 Tax=Massilibacteroides sp. TaxID=2034766 RepID=UPI002636C76F|nr:ferric reductase-like transmembrane domain-containing protein [Massilibacteroides sp.]MDD4514726.1 ferric reductase-like transmembrane domain-containing protein [Massilibacteroides sp.]